MDLGCRPENSELSEASLEALLTVLHCQFLKDGTPLHIHPTQVHFTPEALRKWFGWTEADFGIDSLSTSERNVLTLMGRGFSTAQIAERLFRSVRTIESHTDRMRTKLGLKDIVALRERAKCMRD